MIQIVAQCTHNVRCTCVRLLEYVDKQKKYRNWKEKQHTDKNQ